MQNEALKNNLMQFNMTNYLERNIQKRKLKTKRHKRRQLQNT